MNNTYQSDSSSNVVPLFESETALARNMELKNRVCLGLDALIQQLNYIFFKLKVLEPTAFSEETWRAVSEAQSEIGSFEHLLDDYEAQRCSDESDGSV